MNISIHLYLPIGDIVVNPVCYNVIPKSVELYVEIRGIDNQNIEKFIKNLKIML